MQKNPRPGRGSGLDDLLEGGLDDVLDGDVDLHDLLHLDNLLDLDDVLNWWHSPGREVDSGERRKEHADVMHGKKTWSKKLSGSVKWIWMMIDVSNPIWKKLILLITLRIH